MKYIITPHIPRKIKKELKKVSIEWHPIRSPFYLNWFLVKVEGKQNKWARRLVTLLRRITYRESGTFISLHCHPSI